MRARSARSAVVAVVAGLALATGGVAYGASVVGGGSTADVQPDEGTPGVAPGGTADMLPGATVVQDKPTGVVKPDLGVKNRPATEDKGVKNLPAGQDLGDR
jgi:hypothetical protein